MMLEFEFRGGLIAGIRKNKLAVCTIEEMGKLFWISADCDSCELRQIADKLDELHGAELPLIFKGSGVMAKWIEYAGSDEQIDEIKSAKHGVMFWYIAGYGIDRAIYRYKDHKYHVDNRIGTKAISKYLICEPHPYADIIEIWAKTGCEVWVRWLVRDSTFPDKVTNVYNTIVTDKPDWNIPGAEYRLTPFDDRKE